MTRLSFAFAAESAFLDLLPAATAGELFGGVYAHDIDDQVSHGHYEEGLQIVIGPHHLAGRAQVHLQAQSAPARGRKQRGGTNYVAAGFSRRLPVCQRVYVNRGLASGEL